MNRKKLYVFLGLLVFILIWSFLLFYFSPMSIVQSLGVTNSYLFLALMAFIGGTSILLPIPYHIFTISFAAAGLNPFLLGIAAGLGALIGDSTTYYIAYRGHDIIPRKNKFFNKIFDWLLNKKPFFLPIFAFFYAALIPLSDDIIMIPAGLAHYPFKRLIISLGLGKILFHTLLAFSGFYGLSLLF